jgi:DNA polymerase III psi subunit
MMARNEWSAELRRRALRAMGTPDWQQRAADWHKVATRAASPTPERGARAATSGPRPADPGRETARRSSPGSGAAMASADAWANGSHVAAASGRKRVAEAVSSRAWIVLESALQAESPLVAQLRLVLPFATVHAMRPRDAPWPKLVLSLGVDLTEEGAGLLRAPGLMELRQNAVAKQRLWQQLRTHLDHA